jgi:uncharacterized phage protein (TIGR02216 family)
MSWPFREWHRIAVRSLNLQPSEFWAMPLADWLALLAPETAPMDRAQLDDLIKEYPDD